MKAETPTGDRPDTERLVALARQLREAALAMDTARIAQVDQQLRSHALAVTGALDLSGERAVADLDRMSTALTILREIAAEIEAERRALATRQARERKMRLVYSQPG